MQTQNISFCDKIGLNIRSNDVKMNILDDLEEIKIIDKHHEIFNKERHDKRLHIVPHMISVRSNGNPYYMYFTRISMTNTIVLIDKKVQMGYSYPRMIIVRLTFKDDHLFDNTLIDGEMIKFEDPIKKTNTWLYLVSDIHVYKNKNIKNLDLFKRINIVYDILQKDFVPSHNDIFNIQVKKYTEMSDVTSFYNEFIPSLPYTCRGVYLKPLYSKFKDILFNFDNNVINKQIKPRLNNKYHFATNENIVQENLIQSSSKGKATKDAQVVKKEQEIPETSNKTSMLLNIKKTDVPDLYKLYDDKNNYIGNACVDTIHVSKMLRNHFSNKTMIETSRFLCEKTKNKHLSTQWVPIEHKS